MITKALKITLEELHLTNLYNKSNRRERQRISEYAKNTHIYPATVITIELEKIGKIARRYLLKFNKLLVSNV